MKHRTKKLALTRAQLAGMNAPEKFEGRQANKDILRAIRELMLKLHAIAKAANELRVAAQAMRERQSATIH